MGPFSKWGALTQHPQIGVSQLKVGNIHPQEKNLAKFGYRPDMKIEF